jgi:hypothetical protein
MGLFFMDTQPSALFIPISSLLLMERVKGLSMQALNLLFHFETQLQL